MAEDTPHYLVVGHSHAGTMKRGFDLWLEMQPPGKAGLSCDFVLIRELGVETGVAGKRRITNIEADVVPFIRAAVKRQRPDVIFASLFGNSHSFISIPQHPRPFDLIVPWREDLPFTETAELIPYKAIRQQLLTVLKARMARYVEHLKSESPGTPLWLIPPPPPIASDSHILENACNLGPIIKTTGVSPATLRLKVWLVNLDVLAEIAKDSGVRLVDLPQDVFDDEGYLHAQLLDRDPTHGNPAYGQILLRHLHRLHQEEAR